VDRRTRNLLILAGGCAALFGVVLFCAYSFGPGRSLDQLGLSEFRLSDHGRGFSLPYRFVHFGNPLEVALITSALAALAIARGRPRVALVVIALVATTSISSQVLKAVLSHPRIAEDMGWLVGPQAFPSGHATAAMSLALAGVIAVPRSARLPAALLGAILAVGVGGSVIALGWHFPSDVFGGYLLAMGWTLVLLAFLNEADLRFPASDRWTGTTLARTSDRIAASGVSIAATSGAVATALLATATLAALPGGPAEFAREHTAFVVVAAGVASAALALPVAMAGLLRRS
jgi:membrane-associated phospholipid phosphatase